ncbi:MAG TPA: T9SS type A sorting domain-containing protein [Flavisolibacter sp.]|jgi:hypothetical protein|nr:T9SS type A sorting domain-containing protein [Flavisolibacter sp.]
MRRILTLAFASLCLSLTVNVFAQDTKTATSVTQAGGNDSWTGTLVAGVQGSDNVYITSNIGSNKTSAVLSLTGFNFNIPAGSIISGVSVSVERRAGTANKTADQQVQLIVNGTATGTDKASAAFWPTTDAAVTYGAPNDKWGIATISAADVNAANFGVAIQAQSGPSGGAAFIDAVSVTVFYSEAASLPVRFMGLDVKRSGSQVTLNWKVAREENLSGYSVERSADGSHFASIYFTKANDWNEYTYSDARPLSGTSFYRIKSVDKDSKYSYSAVVSVKDGGSDVVLKAFPLPAQNQVTLQHASADAARKIQLTTADGRLVKAITPAAGTQQTVIDLTGLKAGLYMIRFDGAGAAQVLKLIKQ